MPATVGNAVNSLSVFSLPVGPIWFLHVFNLGCTLLMLAWHLRYAGRRPGQEQRDWETAIMDAWSMLQRISR